jgi:hypothetical protein
VASVEALGAWPQIRRIGVLACPAPAWGPREQRKAGESGDARGQDFAAAGMLLEHACLVWGLDR